VRPPQIPLELKGERTWSSTLLGDDKSPEYGFALKRDRQTDISGEQSNNEHNLHGGWGGIASLRYQIPWIHLLVLLVGVV